MSEWHNILLEAEDMWENSTLAFLLINRNLTKEEYNKERDMYKAGYIYKFYGYDYYKKFIENLNLTKGDVEDASK